MSNNKQSSIEFLIKQKEKWGLLINDDLRIAKAMHKEEIDNKVIHFAEWLTKKHTLELMTLYNQFEETFGGNNEQHS